MPRKAKQFKSRLRGAQKAAKQGNKAEANQIWQQITVDRAKLKADRAAKKAAKKQRAK